MRTTAAGVAAPTDTTQTALVRAPTSVGLSAAHASLAHHSKSFALAGKLLPSGCRDDAAVVYAYCRRVDDVIDEGDGEGAAARAASLQAELAALYAGAPQRDPVLAAFQEVVFRRRVPQIYPEELVAGMAMDAAPAPIVYETERQLELYCYRVAGVVGLMMCHVMGIKDERRLRNAAHLGMAMQLTNICRDVAEDWTRGRLYVPLERLGALPMDERPAAGATLPRALVPLFARALPSLLARAEALYRSGDDGLPALSLRCAIAIKTARLVYAAIGDELAARAYDVTAGRAVVPKRRKIAFALRALVEVPLGRAGARVVGLVRPLSSRSSRSAIPATVVRYTDDIACD